MAAASSTCFFLLLSSSCRFLSEAKAVSVSVVPRVGVGVVRGQVKGKGGLGKWESSKEQKWVTEGMITESLPNGMFWVRLDNGDVVLGYISGKIRRNSIRMLAGDKVKIEVSRYDSTRGRIVYRI